MAHLRMSELRVTVAFATTGETHSTVLQSNAVVSDLAKELQKTSQDALGSCSFLRDGLPLRMEDRISCSADLSDVTIQLVVHRLEGRWTWKKGEKPDEKQEVAHDYECHVLLLRGDGQAQSSKYHTWRRDDENYGSQRTIIGCTSRPGPKDELSSAFLRGEGAHEGRGVWEVQQDPEPTLCVSGAGFTSAGIIENDDLVVHGAGPIPHEVFTVTLRDLLSTFEFSQE
ncbi:unnamed protein product [Symbiodinium natans]|uniref:Uncharacterized protein n=1 Tax=Symbiodinium natans TaxID=878477 RepID=A0A812PAS4_9DINO|nr:unnamed protein product [Symbiodinium natans]